MNEWLNDEVKRIERERDENRAQDDRLKLIQQQTSRVWEQLKALIQNATEQINSTEELRKKTGGLNGQFGYVHKVEIVKATYPAIYLTVERGPVTIDISGKLVTNGENRRSREFKDVLYVDLDQNGHPFLKTQDGKNLTIEEGVRHILTPLLRPDSLEGGRELNVY